MIRTLLFSLAMLAVAAPIHAQDSALGDTLSARVLDARSAEPVIGATVRVVGQTRGVAADADGAFQLVVSRGDVLVVSAIGYAPKRVQTSDLLAQSQPIVRLMPAAIELSAVMVDGASAVAGAPSAPTRTPATTEDLLARLPGVSMIQRANFAAEPVVRGYSGGQISLTIDGMPVYGACVDRMDPASSYVEPENLARVEVTRGAGDLSQGSQIGGSVDLVTQRPRFGSGLSTQGETGFESNGSARRVRGVVSAGGERWAARASASYRAADDYTAGGGSAIQTSGYNKRNVAAAASFRPAQGHTLTAQVLTDDAWLIGYPALLMDAVLAQARIVSLTYRTEMVGGWHHTQARAYRSRVDHYMDDRERNVLAREVMRGMFMPMGGYTDVWGGSVEAMRTVAGVDVGLTADLHRVRQFGDMTMLSLYPGIQDMVLLNVGDATATNGSATLTLGHTPTQRLSLSASARVDLTARDVGRDEMRPLLTRRTDSDDPSRRLAVPSLSLGAQYAFTPTLRLRLTLADAGRLPTLVEQYGHYVYNYVDGYFYTGNPDLRPERSRQAEVGLLYANAHLALDATAYAHRLDDLVVGLAERDVIAGLAGSTYRFRYYENVERGWRTGAEVSALLHVGGGWEAAAGVSAAYGQNQTFAEPLPLVPPVGGTAAIRYDKGGLFAETELRWALRQDRVARFTYAERPTDGYAIWALRLGWRPSGAPAGLHLQAGAENLFDTAYRDHLALTDLAARGRSIYASVGFAL